MIEIPQEISTHGLARMARVNPSSIFDWQNGQVSPSLDKRITNAILKFLNERDRKRMILKAYGKEFRIAGVIDLKEKMTLDRVQNKTSYDYPIPRYYRSKRNKHVFIDLML